MLSRFNYQGIIYTICIFGLIGTVRAGETLVHRNSVRYSENHFSLAVSPGRFVQATVRMPISINRAHKRPVFMVFGGFESAAHVLDLVHPNKSVVLASFDYPFSASRKLELQNSLEILKQSKTLFSDTVAGIVALAKLLKQIPEIDSKTIVGIGASFGAPFVLAAATHNPDINRIVLIHAFGQVPETANHVILKSWLPRYGWISRPMAWAISRLASIYLGFEDPEESALNLNSEQKVLMITAQDDSFIPRASSDSLWKSIESSKAKGTRIVMPGDHLMPGSELLISQIVQTIENWLD